jgi:hypothetical protein
VREITIGEKGVVRMTMAAPPAVEGKSVIFVPKVGAGGEITWRCSPEDTPPRYLPPSCR